ncbi:MAG: hypothetical protein LW832_10680 [Parachlamydia sp.]|nr:hypothetical protein [Parachlamydia sp.]
MKVITSQIYDFNFGKWYKACGRSFVPMASVTDSKTGMLPEIWKTIFDQYVALQQ